MSASEQPIVHTSGPWEAVRSLTCGHLRAGHNYKVHPTDEWTDADLRLISEAPEMFQVIQRLAEPGFIGESELKILIQKCRRIVEKVV